MGRDEKREEHPSYGMLKICRTQCSNSRSLFGSSIKHRDLITLTISRADRIRELSNDWFYPHDDIVEITMSNTQFAEAITSLNTIGVPITISRIGYDAVEPCPDRDVKEDFDKEFEGKIKQSFDTLESLESDVRDLFQSGERIKRGDKDNILQRLAEVKREMTNNIPFIKKQFSKSMDKTTLEAKGAIEGFWINKINSLGVSALKNSENIVSIDVKSGEGDIE